MFQRLLLIAVFSFTLPAHAGSWVQTSLGGFSSVDIYTPDSVSSIGQGRSLLLVLHGCTQAISAYRTANLETAAEAHGMVIAVPDAENKAGFACWSYWQGTISRNAGDYRNLINLATALIADGNRQIDADQVYIAGLSSGATFANTTACLAPDIFAGVGVSAGPSIGTSANGAIGTCETADVAARCRLYAGGLADHFQTQMASIAQGVNDTTVNSCYNQQNSEGMAAVYGVSQLSGTQTLSEGSGHTATQTLWEDNRVSLVRFNNVGHAWSGGAGASGSFISGGSINYASYLGEFFTANNQRVSRNQAPEINGLSAQDNAGRVRVSGQVQDPEGAPDHVAIDITRIADDTPVSALMVTTAADGQFSADSAVLSDDLYAVTAVAFDQEGAGSLPLTISVRIGPPPPPAAPVLSDITVETQGQCVAIGGRVVDANDDLSAVTVNIDQLGAENASVSGLDFVYSRCELSGGAHQAVIVASDVGGLTSSSGVSFDIDAGITATLTQHIDAGRLDFTAYANCYLTYGETTAFRLDENDLGDGQCQWSDGATCTGPVVACRDSAGDGGGDGGGGGGDPQPTPTCVEATNYNYYHKVAARAYSTGPVLTPDYFAEGSDDPLPGSTWGLNTVHSVNDDGHWQVGGCP